MKCVIDLWILLPGMLLMLRVYMVEKSQICMLEAAEMYQQSNTLCLPCSSIGLLLLDIIGYRAIC